MTIETDPAAFQLFTEIGILEQLSRNRLEDNLPYGLKASQFGVLNHLVRLGGSWSPSRLAKAFQVTKGAMTNTLQRLEAKGFVQITSDPRDARGKCVIITEAGIKARSECVQSVGPLLTELSMEISEKEIRDVLPTLEKIRIYLDERRS